jgi:transcriptional activator of cad operon
MATENAGEVVRIGEWLVSPSLDSVARGDEVQKLEPRTMRLLMRLVDAGGDVVSVERLLTEVWSGVIVGPASVYQAISQLRKIFNDTEQRPTYIATVPRRGYRLVAPVTRPAPPAPTPPAGPAADPRPAMPDANPRVPAMRAALLIALLVIACAAAWIWLRRSPGADAPNASIVVLPFVDMTSEKTGQAFCDGLSEELSNWLSQIPSLRVVARTSAFAFRTSGADVREIGKALGTSHVIEGSMRRFGDHMRVTVQLIDARNGFHLWSANYDQPIEDTIRMQDDIARSVAQNLQLRLTPATTSQFAARGSDSAEAYQAYLQARYEFHQRTREANRQAIDGYYRALNSDPKFALAYVGLSYALLNQQWLENRPIGDIALEVEPLLATAMRLDSRLPDGYAARAALRSDQNRIEEARSDLNTAIAMNPNDSTAIAELGRLALRQGRPRQALPDFLRAVALDPLDFGLRSKLCTAYADMARNDEALAACQRAHELQPDNAEVVDGLTWFAWSRGALGDALRWNRESLRLAPDVFDYYWTRGELYWTLGLARRARTTLEQGRAATHEEETAAVALGSVAYLDGGPAALRLQLAQAHLDDSPHAVILEELARLRLLLGEADAAAALVNRALTAADRQPELTDTPWSARTGESCQLRLAAAELQTGKEPAAQARLNRLVGMLDGMIHAGVERAQVYALRAEAEALLGRGDPAMHDLAQAVRLGWRRAWWAEREPYLASLRSRQDFRDLMAAVNRTNRDLMDALGLADSAEELPHT